MTSTDATATTPAASTKKTNGAAGAPQEKRENRGRGIKPALERAVVKELKAETPGTKIAKMFNIASSTIYGIRDRHGIKPERKKKKPVSRAHTTEEILAKKVRVVALFAAGKTPAEVAKLEGVTKNTAVKYRRIWAAVGGTPPKTNSKAVVLGGQKTKETLVQRRARFDTHFDAGKTAIEVAELEGLTHAGGHYQHKRWRKARGLPDKLGAAPAPAATPGVVQGIPLSAQKAFDLAYEGAYDYVHSGGRFEPFMLDFLRGYGILFPHKVTRKRD